MESAVIYARYSSDNQRDVSIEQQYAACEAYAARAGLTVIEHYPDRAISGKSASVRLRIMIIPISR